MRIAMVAPLTEPVPPSKYGGTERVVSVLTEELVARGHDVTLFASGDSETRARLVACSERSLRLHGDELLPSAAILLELGLVYANVDDFDIVHNHVDWVAFPFVRLNPIPTVTTVHGRLDLAPIRSTYERFPEQQLVSISKAQRAYLPHASWMGTVYNGIALEQFHFVPEAGGYLVFLGRLSPEKRPDRAIEIARRVGMKLVIAAKVDPADQDYFEQSVSPLIEKSSWVEYVGEVSQREKDQILGGAFAYLFPIDWPEPFGLTVAEAMATGTPVIATRFGAVPEIIVDGVTGFICDDVDGMVAALEKVGTLQRADCRTHVERNFSAATMTDGYEAIYRRLVSPSQDKTAEMDPLRLASLTVTTDMQSASQPG